MIIPKGLYAISDENLTPDDIVVEKIKIALECGIKIFQYRNKTKKDNEILHICHQLKELADSYGAIFVIDDRIEIANKVKAHALHIGKDDIRVSEAREKFDGILGVSCYGDIELAKKAQDDGADYVAFGSFFKSKTKPSSVIAPFEVLNSAKKYLNIPICVIGGINSQNISLFKPYNVDMISVVNAIFEGDDICNNIKNLTNNI